MQERRPAEKPFPPLTGGGKSRKIKGKLYRRFPPWGERGKDGIVMEYLIGIDLGTSGTKTVLFDRLGKVIASATVEYPMYQERNGWAEQDPLDWWRASCETLQSVIQQGGVDPRDIKGLGISGQMHGLVMLDKQGRVLRRSIIWCDQRTARQCEEITQRVGKERLIQITANPALTGFTASKILWVRENEPELYAQCAHILLPKDYVRYMLTGEFATEVSDASGMQLLDVPHRCWSQEVLEKLDIDPALLAKVYESPEITGAITPEAAAQCAHILLPKDYVRYMLTGEFATEVSDASGMQLLDVPHRCWSQEVLEKLDIDPALLAKVYESPEITGAITPEAAALTGLAAGTPVVGGAGDNAAAAVGTGVVADGKAFTTIGTSGVVFAHTDNISIDPQGRVHTFCCAVPGAWHVMGVTQGAGLSLKWFRDNFCQAEKDTAAGMGVDPYVLMDQEAGQSPIGCNRLLYLPYLMGERTPHLDPDCRGVFFGLSAMHTKRDLLRAVMEGVTYSQRDSVEILRGMGVELREMLACGGGGTSPLWRQMLADTYNCPVKTVKSKEGPALGVAILAGVGVGLYPSVQEACQAMIQLNPAQEPIPENVPQYEAFYQVYKSLYPALKENYKLLAATGA